jgi:hypothetical protein
VRELSQLNARTFDGPTGSGVRTTSATNPEPPEDMIVRRGVWRFARLFAVGFAWGAPLVPAVAVNSAPGVAVHPKLARLLDHHGWQLFVAMLVLCCLGIILVALLTHRPSRVRIAWVFVPVALVLVIAVALAAPDGSYALFLLYALTLLGAPIALVSLGVAVTVATLWRRWRWVALAWLSLWLGVVIFVSIATSTTPDSDGPGDGLLVLALIVVLLAVAVFAAVLTAVLGGVPDWMARARHIEQALGADAPEA